MLYLCVIVRIVCDKKNIIKTSTYFFKMTPVRLDQDLVAYCLHVLCMSIHLISDGTYVLLLLCYCASVFEMCFVFIRSWYGRLFFPPLPQCLAAYMVCLVPSALPFSVHLLLNGFGALSLPPMAVLRARLSLMLPNVWNQEPLNRNILEHGAIQEYILCSIWLKERRSNNSGEHDT